MTRVTRSPNYPSLSLGDAIDRARVVWEKEHKHLADKEVIAEDLGYSSLNGASTAVISSLIKYGLLQPVGNQLRISEDALDILLHRRGDPEYSVAIQKAALAPALFEDLHETYAGHLPSEHNLRASLIKKGFNPRSLDAVIKSYRDTMEFVARETEIYERADVRSQPSEVSQLSHAPIDNGIQASENAIAFVRGQASDEYSAHKKELVFQLTEDCAARTVFTGRVTQEALDNLVDFLKLSKRAFPKDLQERPQESTLSTPDDGDQ